MSYILPAFIAIGGCGVFVWLIYSIIKFHKLSEQDYLRCVECSCQCERSLAVQREQDVKDKFESECA